MPDIFATKNMSKMIIDNMKQEKSKITTVAIWILLCGWMMCMSSCGSLLYNPSNKVEQVTVTIKQPIK